MMFLTSTLGVVLRNLCGACCDDTRPCLCGLYQHQRNGLADSISNFGLREFLIFFRRVLVRSILL